MTIHFNRAFFQKHQFKRIHRRNFFNGETSLSGRGSDEDQTKVIEDKLPKLFKSLSIKSILDIPCGDQNWIKRLDLSFLDFTGADIVPKIIEINNSNFGSDQ